MKKLIFTLFCMGMVVTNLAYAQHKVGETVHVKGKIVPLNGYDANDRLEKTIAIKLDEPFVIDTTDCEDCHEYKNNHYLVTLMQVAGDDNNLWQRMYNSKGKSVEMNCMVWGAHTAHHHTEMLCNPSNVRIEKQSILGTLPEKFTIDSPCSYYRYGTNDKILAYFDVNGLSSGAYANINGNVVKLTADYKDDLEIFRYQQYTLKMRRDSIIKDNHYINTLTVYGNGKPEVIKVYQNCEE